MPRFFFHVETDAAQLEDNEGSVLHDLEAARLEALRTARELWAQAIIAGREPGARTIVIAGDDGVELARLPLVEALPPSLRR